MVVQSHSAPLLKDGTEKLRAGKPSSGATANALWKFFDANPDPQMISHLSDGKVLRINLAFLAKEFAAKSVVGASVADLGLWQDDGAYEAYWSALQAYRQVQNSEAEIRLVSGAKLVCLVSGFLIELDEGECVVTTFRDIDAIKHSEYAMKEALGAAEAASRAKTEFLSSMSHEIRTPMNALLGMAEVLGDSPLSAEQQKYLSIMINSGGSLLDLINDILDFARVESGHLQLERTEFDLHEAVERVAEMLAIKAHQKKLELIVNIAPGTPSGAVGDPLRLRQILVNLIGNAIKFTGTGEIELKVSPEDNNCAVHFAIRDTGVGIAADQLDAIFEGYRQAEASTARKYGGTGLGLAIVKQLTDLMGGRIWVESQIGQGTTFHVVVRLDVKSKPTQPRNDPPPLLGVKVLVVDDSPGARYALASHLAHQGAIVTTASSGNEALERVALEGNRDSIVLLDCRMAQMDGCETARQMQANGLDMTKVIPMVTADDLNQKLPLLRKLGLLRHLIKPVRRAEVTAAVQAVATPAVPEPPEPAEAAMPTPPPVPSRVIMPASREATRESQPLGRPMRVLVADDSEDNRLLIDAFLKKTGCSVEHADNGEIAVRKFMENQYDVVLMDIQMPVMDGYQAVREIRTWEEAQGISRTPVIALTASVLDEAVGKSFEAGCDTHVSKPIRRATLMTAISEVVTAANAADETAAAG